MRSHIALEPFTLSSMGAWTTAELRGRGLSKDAIRRKVREGKLFRVRARPCWKNTTEESMAPAAWKEIADVCGAFRSL